MIRWAVAGYVGLIFAVSLLTACGGGGGSSGTSVFDGSGSSSSTGSGTESSTSGSVSSTSAGTVVLSLSSETISASTPGTVSALVKRSDGTPLKNILVKFSVPGAKAVVSPDSVLTNDQGSASVSLTPLATASGADYVKATADLSTTASAETRVPFTVSPITVSLTSITADPSNVSAYGSSVIAVAVNGASSVSPVTIKFSSTCASSGKANLSPSSLTMTSGTSTITYQDKGCAATDRVSASIDGTSQQGQVDLVVSTPTALALEFSSASPSTICIAGSGCAETSAVKFRLKDQVGNPVSQKEVQLSLDIANVASLSANKVVTDKDGYAEVSVKSGSVPTPVRVKAVYTPASGTSLSTVSNVLTINAGLPTQRGVSLSAGTFNVDGWSRDGTESNIRMQLNDRFGNPVPDGTAISFVSEGASVIPASCMTSSGVCSVKFVSSNFRPSNGRVTVIAYAQGEESFDDVDGDNRYSSGELFSDLGRVFVDKNENSLMDNGEYIAGSDANGVWDGNTYVRYSQLFILSESAVIPRLFVVSGGACTSTPLPPQTLSPSLGACRASVQFCMRDANTNADASGGNPVPAAATLVASTKAKGATVSVDMTPIPSTLRPTIHTLTAELSDCSKAVEASGPIDVTVKMPAGQSYTYNVGSVQ